MNANEYGYNYDPILLRSYETTAGHVGNRNRAVTNAVATDYEANGLNQYTSIEQGATVSPAYDFDGNMLTNATHAFTWDAENRLLTASKLTTQRPDRGAGWVDAVWIRKELRKRFRTKCS